MSNLETGNSAEEKTPGQELNSYVENLEFGTPEFQAVCDCVELQQLYANRAIELGHIVDEKSKPADLQSWVNHSQVTNQRIALLEHEAYLGKSRLEGYSQSFTRMEDGFIRGLPDQDIIKIRNTMQAKIDDNTNTK